MTLETVLLNHRQILKIRLLMLIKEDSTFDLAAFANQTQLNYAKAYNLLMTVAADLKQAGYAVQIQTGQLATNATLNDYRRLLYHSTIAYQCLLSSLKGDYSSAAQFCAAKMISTSTLQRHLQPLKKYLSQFNLRFSPQNFSINGDETLVQTFFYQFFTATLTNLPTSSQSLIWLERLQQTYQSNGHLPATIGLKRQQTLLINLNLIRLQQGYTLPKMPITRTPSDSVAANQAFLEQRFGLTPNQAEHHLQTLDYLLTFAPFFSSSWQLNPHPQSSEMQEWLRAIAFFIINFGVSPLFHSNVEAPVDQVHNSQTVTQIIQELTVDYQLSLSERQLRLLDQKLKPYLTLLNHQQQLPTLLIGTEMLVVGHIWSATALPLLGNLHLIDTTQPAQTTDRQTIVIYESDLSILEFAKRFQLPVFHWVKELGTNENLQRLVNRLYDLKLGYFAN